MTLRLLYRWAVFLLAAGYAVPMGLFGDDDGVGGPFRSLTVRALFASFFCASRMIALEEGRSEWRRDGLVAATAVLNAMVVMLYWRLFLQDPASVTRDGAPGAWWLEVYLHGLGPLLQWTCDALHSPRVPAALGGFGDAPGDRGGLSGLRGAGGGATQPVTGGRGDERAALSGPERSRAGRPAGFLCREGRRGGGAARCVPGDRGAYPALASAARSAARPVR